MLRPKTRLTHCPSMNYSSEPQVGIEPTTARLRIECSTPELLWQDFRWLLMAEGRGLPRVQLSALSPQMQFACPGSDSNRDALRHHPLKMACLPVSPPGRTTFSCKTGA